MLVIISFLLSGVSVFAQQSPTEKFLLQLHEKKFRWMTEKKLDSLQTILDERLVYIHSNGWMETGKEVIDDLKNGKLTMNSVKVNEATVRVFKNNTGIVNGKGVFNVVVNDKQVELSLYYTEVYIKKKNNWMLVSRHACKL
ncbi:MAG: nuclear transport factor 2 family protein [Sphingobacteriales bacterium]|nr:nuclear transport factor 2 family protein [Sphingobacteriales bacterium]MBI3717409.1 nuclear transport factor 2 family protein [Sphingobacteriales bacterium]